jgi:hypothetical protein
VSGEPIHNPHDWSAKALNPDTCVQVRSLWACVPDTQRHCWCAAYVQLTLPIIAKIVHPAVGVTLNCEKVVKMLTALQRRQQARACVLGAPGAHAPGATGLLLEGGGRQPSSQCDVLVCARGGDGRLQVSATVVLCVKGVGCCSV